MGNLAVSSLEMDPTNHNEFYSGSGDGFFSGDTVHGAGIFKSTGGGVMWNQITSTNPPSAIRAGG
jgi:hypothetical protein